MEATAPVGDDPMPEAPAVAAPTATVTVTATDARADVVTETNSHADTETDSHVASHAGSTGDDALDLVAVEADLADVETALARLEAGTYWTCEVTGEALPDDLMAAEPTRRRLPAG